MATVRGFLRDSVRRRAHNTCEKCGKPIVKNKTGLHNGSIHHRRPRRMGGRDILPNLVLVCLTCHRDIHKDESSAAREGWISWVDPEMTPVLLFGEKWALLEPNGGFDYVSTHDAMMLLEYVNGVAFSGKDYWESA